MNTTTTTRRGRQVEVVTTVKVGDDTSVQLIERFYDGEKTETIHWYIDASGHHPSTASEYKSLQGIK